MELKRVVITGLGAVTPLGKDVSSTWQAMLAGQSGVADITLFDTINHKTHFAAEVKDFNPCDYIDRKTAGKMDRFTQFSVIVSDQAIADAGLCLDSEDCNRIGVVWGSGMGGLQSFEEGVIVYGHGTAATRYSPFFLPKILISMGAGNISLRHGLRGVTFGVTSACSSASHAIATAFDQIRLGRADIILSGGADADITISGIGSFNSIHALSTRNDSPATACRPFSASRDGFVMGEGASCLVLEEYEHAVARGAKIYAELVGVGVTSDAYHLTAPEPNGEGAARVMKLAIEDAGITPEQVGYINAHGTSTPLGDVAELRAIQSVFGEHAYRLNISSTKSMTGHLLGAAGAVEAMATILALKEGIVPPTINHEEDDKDENIDYQLNLTFNQAQRRDMQYALSNTFGFGGHNACLLFKKM